jgi:hypothetical protein
LTTAAFAALAVLSIPFAAIAQYETDSLPPGVEPRSGLALPSPLIADPAVPNPAPTLEVSSFPVAQPPAESPLILHAPPTTPDEKARFLAGRRLLPGSRIASIQSTPWYLNHAKAFSSSWRGFDEKYFSKMRAWSAQQVAPRIGNPPTVFYLFGGPDFINVYALFPDAQNYILGGLEPVGSMVPPEQLDEVRLAAGLSGLRESTSLILQFSHFITKDMKVDFGKTDFKGVLPVLLAFVSLGGGEIVNVQFFGISRAGDLTLSATPASIAGTLPGVLVEFRKSPIAPMQSLYYIRADASDGALKANPAMLNWMRRFSPGVSYLKAASYLLHEPYFSTVRSFLLNDSQAVLQDDSGIPLQYFTPGEWSISVFGNYTGTLDLFQKYIQPDLIDAYRTAPPSPPLDFGTGYKWQLGESNLILAVRRIAAPTPPATNPVAPAR